MEQSQTSSYPATVRDSLMRMAISNQDGDGTLLMRLQPLCKGNINQIAKLLEIDQKTICRKMGSVDPSHLG